MQLKLIHGLWENFVIYANLVNINSLYDFFLQTSTECMRGQKKKTQLYMQWIYMWITLETIEVVM